ncbi:hypothetical protein [Thomasclavelia sp.]|uniref:hypothetical protein n=1 Tax=Thomasclavelia sp. TaxID=3025757 RepID=UPI0025E6807F|nr:hypothetical protein [Thomasclavelia sp.]
MELIFVEIINSTKVLKIVKYLIITILIGFLEFVFIGVAITGISKMAMPVGSVLSIIFLMIYIYLIVRIKKYNCVSKR